MDKTADSAPTESDDVEPTPEALANSRAPFGDDDLGRLQSILLGDHARKTVERIDTLEQALLGVIDDLRGELRERVAEIDARIAGEADVRSTAVSNVTSRLENETKERTNAVKSIGRQLDKEKSANKASFAEVASQLTTATGELASTINSKIDEHVDSLTARVDQEGVERSAAVDDLTAQIESKGANQAAELGALGARIDKEHLATVTSINSRFDEERNTNDAIAKDLSADLRSTENDLNQAVDAAESKLLSKIDGLRESAEARSELLNDTKVDRTSLSELLTRLAADVQASEEPSAAQPSVT